MTTTQQLHELFAKAFEIPVEAVSDELIYQGIAEWDSMSHVVLIDELEKAYGISIEQGDVLEMLSIKKVKEVLKKYGIEVI